MDGGIQAWHWECSTCNYENAELAPAINQATAHDQIDEQFREKGLRPLRVDNFDKLLHAIIENRKKTGSLLDVGCAHGWFLERAGEMGFKALGIEPDLHVYEATHQRGLHVRRGFFPEVLSSNEQFDVIVFNDVFEHIPDVKSTLAECRAHLKPAGMLVLNLPSSSGVFYRTSRLLLNLGIGGFFERLWQKDLPSPHLHYFCQENLRQLLERNGFKEIAVGRLSTISMKGLYTRVSYTRGHSLPVRLLICLIVTLAFPIIFMMPSDIVYSLSTKNGGESG
ncbi:class I SAM-dependent methyltransferase [Uliginosibacterium sp. H3]|uniref:Class I SAM-dependent methyltransferase n=1 Tax=Uliginosibacterium silvisoli TaxID=3114758 RepID=A0ABU6K1N7_9RHOO|nr:class I SAM-dependent methyltransferase [Uliginosibacterium sp. H3]